MTGRGNARAGRFLLLPAVPLALLAVGVAVFLQNGEADVSPSRTYSVWDLGGVHGDAGWIYQSVQELAGESDAIVLGRVVAVKNGPSVPGYTSNGQVEPGADVEQDLLVVRVDRSVKGPVIVGSEIELSYPPLVGRPSLPSEPTLFFLQDGTLLGRRLAKRIGAPDPGEGLPWVFLGPSGILIERSGMVVAPFEGRSRKARVAGSAPSLDAVIASLS